MRPHILASIALTAALTTSSALGDPPVVAAPPNTPPKSDLRVTSVYFSPGPKLYVSSQARLSIQVVNEDMVTVNQTSIKVSFLAKNANGTYIPHSSQVVSIGPIVKGQPKQITRDFVPGPLGARGMRAVVVVDPEHRIVESDESNNSRQIDIPLKQPELTLTEISASPSHMTRGGSGHISAKLSNVGDLYARGSRIVARLVRQGQQPVEVLDHSLSQMDPSTAPTIFTFPSHTPDNIASGTWFLEVEVDPDKVVPEANHTNNIKRIAITVQ